MSNLIALEEGLIWLAVSRLGTDVVMEVSSVACWRERRWEGGREGGRGRERERRGCEEQ
jgi:hypothetical protein